MAQPVPEDPGRLAEGAAVKTAAGYLDGREETMFQREGRMNEGMLGRIVRF